MKSISLFILLLLSTLCYSQNTIDSTAIKLEQYKDLFIKGLITAQEYETLKGQLLNLPTKQTQQVQPITVVEVPIVKDSAQLAQDSILRRKMYKQGTTDAQRYYHSGGAFGGTFVTTIFGSPLIGLIPAIACSSTPPKIQNLNYPDSELYKNSDYANGYMLMARKMKRQNVWAAWGGGFILDTLIGVATGIVVSRSNKKH